MEPLTVIATIASRYGIAKLIDALTGDKDLGALAVELVGALAASEDRLGERLAGIERRLDEVLEQRYTTAVGTGLRTLLDAGTTADSRVREDEMIRARDLFREAGAAARSRLQVAIAERYLLLCAVALGRPDAARTALRRLDGAATAALFEAGQSALLLNASVEAHARLDRTGWSGSQRKRDARTAELRDSIREAAGEAAELAGRLMVEAAVLAEGLGDGPSPSVRRLPPGQPVRAAFVTGIHRWEIRPRGAGPVRMGALRVDWHDVRVVKAEQPSPRPATSQRTRGDEFRRRAGLPPLGSDRPRLVSRGRLSGSDSFARAFRRAEVHPFGTLEVDVAVRAEPVLAGPVDVRLDVLGAPSQPVTEIGSRILGRVRTLAAGEAEIRIRQSLPADARAGCTLTVGGLLVFPSPVG
ncbi:MAG: hypothetical protein GEV28_27620 [Actinophytocola sp.]|uniref:hypothetical protein n=1 Tax=Actinophytocola sp. TaxID=1872138 RepID=UPI00132C967A|nr:hypothetical protein [Actinophytocola sp.]MPZ83958.1 hypothetical protein [Actinophytocola sp.]